MQRVSVVGLGKLGLPLAALLAKSGFETIGVDLDEGVVAAVNRGESPHDEPGLAELLREVGGESLRATRDHREAIAGSDTTFVLTATPTAEDGSFSNHQVEAALRDLGVALRESDKEDHLFIISSTVVPGSTMTSFVPLLETTTGCRLNEGFRVAYDPDFVALGSVLKDFANPDIVIIGESDTKAGDRVASIHETLCQSNPQVSRMSIINAEIAKVCLNVYVTLKVSFANTIANLCERIPGADCDVVTAAIGSDKRISPHYFSGGLAFGGTCFPRDVQAFTTISRQHQLEPLIVNAIESVNEYQEEHLTEVVLRELKSSPSPVVGILGLAFKAGTPVVVGSSGMRLARDLIEQGVSVEAYDARAVDEARLELGDSVRMAESVEELLQRCGLCVVTYRSKDFVQALQSFQPQQPLTVLDCWRILDRDSVDPTVTIRVLGRHDARA